MFDAFLQGDITRLPLRDASIAGVWNLGFLEHFDESAGIRILREFRRVLAPGGHAVLFWPPEFGSSRLVLAPIEKLRSVARGSPFRFFPDEVNRLASRAHARRLLEALLRRGCDILVGSRFAPRGTVDRMPTWKTALSRSMNPLMRLAFRMKVRDLTSGYRLYRRDALRAVHFSSNNFAFLPELLFEATARGLLVEEEPIRFTYRVNGRSKMSLWKTSRSYIGLFLRLLRATAAR